MTERRGALPVTATETGSANYDWTACSDPPAESCSDAGCPVHGDGDGPQCPGGCGCRLGTDDADRFECGCDGGCCE
jgi:hypothetical protein